MYLVFLVPEKDDSLGGILKMILGKCLIHVTEFLLFLIMGNLIHI